MNCRSQIAAISPAAVRASCDTVDQKHPPKSWLPSCKASLRPHRRCESGFRSFCRWMVGIIMFLKQLWKVFLLFSEESFKSWKLQSRWCCKTGSAKEVVLGDLFHFFSPLSCALGDETEMHDWELHILKPVKKHSVGQCGNGGKERRPRQ